MIKRIVSVAVVAALTCALGGAPARANTPPKVGGAVRAATPPAPPAAATTTGVSHDGKLKADMLRLVADAKAGKVSTAAPRQSPQPAMSNSLSKGQKIAIGVGIAAAIIVAVVVYKATCDGMC